MDERRNDTIDKHLPWNVKIRFKQASSNTIITHYGPSLYKSLGFGTVQQLLIQCGWISVCPLGNWINALVVDRVGRTRMVMFGFAGRVIVLIGECITVEVFQCTGHCSAASAAVFFLFLHFGFFSSSYNATSYIYALDIFPTPVRARGLSVSISGFFFAIIVFLQCAPVAFTNVGGKYYIVFIVITTVMFCIVWLWFPETRGRSLEDIGEAFGDSVLPVNLDEKAYATGNVEEVEVEQKQVTL